MKIFLKRLKKFDVDQSYVEWMNDPKVTYFLESRWGKFTKKNLEDYVSKIENSKTDYLFGIFLRNPKRHIGNIKIGSINLRHKFADVGLLIGEKSEWGKGYATEAIKLATEYGFRKLRLKKLFAGIYENNVGSYKAFKKCGYEVAGRLKKHRLCGKRRVDVILVERFNP